MPSCPAHDSTRRARHLLLHHRKGGPKGKLPPLPTTPQRSQSLSFNLKRLGEKNHTAQARVAPWQKGLFVVLPLCFVGPLASAFVCLHASSASPPPPPGQSNVGNAMLDQCLGCYRFACVGGGRGVVEQSSFPCLASLRIKFSLLFVFLETHKRPRVHKHAENCTHAAMCAKA